MPAAEQDVLIDELTDERSPLTREGLEILREVFPPRERQPLEQLAMEVHERRLGVREVADYHILVAHTPDGRGMGVVAGVYLGAANAGMVTYLGVRDEFRTRRLGRGLRTRLVEALRDDARRTGHADLGSVVGEVRLESPWLQRLVRERGAIPYDFVYYHPGVGPGWSDERWILYRQPVGDTRVEVPAVEVRRLVYDIWRRAYRVRLPLEHDGFRAMMDELEDRGTVGPLALTD